MKKPEIAIIVARARNGVIGRDNTLPWRLRDDMRLFRERTTGHSIIMGRKTWESLGKPLPNRRHIVITHQKNYPAPPEIIVVDSLEKAVGACLDESLAYVIGGADIYRQALPLADTLWISEILADVPGDTHFPEIPSTEFQEISRERHPASDRNEFAFDVVQYQRKNTVIL